ncbi:MAG: hypothetical protein HYT19_00755 [Candidatus Nealsonbacteria bacterium]|nr:hypothetical protein [Candidatus Nealsonbacteria bacterium]
MPISLLEQKKKYKFLIPILGSLVLATLIILWLAFFKNPSALPSSSITPPVPKININWDTLKNPILETLKSFETIPPLPAASGRKNPFLPY